MIVRHVRHVRHVCQTCHVREVRHVREIRAVLELRDREDRAGKNGGRAAWGERRADECESGLVGRGEVGLGAQVVDDVGRGGRGEVDVESAAEEAGKAGEVGGRNGPDDDAAVGVEDGDGHRE